jgi:hypothetical protein
MLQMKAIVLIALLGSAFFLDGLSGLVSARGLGARLIPDGTVRLMADDQEVIQLESEVPLPDGLLTVIEGNCVVQTSTLQLMFQEESVFALAQTDKGWELTINKGYLDFAVRTDATAVAFRTPQDVIQSEQVSMQSGAQSLVRGYLEVTDTETELVVLQGALQTTGAGGKQLIETGQGMRLTPDSADGTIRALFTADDAAQ